MKTTIAQINTRVWNISYNKSKIEDIIADKWKECDIIVFPELTLTGYPPNDLLENDEFVEEQKSALYDIKQIVSRINQDLAVIVWFVDYDDTKQVPSGSRKKFNAWAIIWKDIKIYHKKLLPNYDIFFEKRYFSKGKSEVYFKIAQELIWSLTICEDIWDKNYRNKPIDELTNPDLKSIFNISSSPYYLWKQAIRYELIQQHLKKRATNFIYVNQVWAQDEIIFDGSSLVFNNNWTLIHVGKSFEEDIVTLDMDKVVADKSYELLERSNDIEWNILKALKLSIRDYLDKSGLQDVVIGISWWIDSAIVAFVLSQVVPKEKIHAVYMPSKHSQSLALSQQLCQNLGIKLMIWEIDPIMKSFMDYSSTNLWSQIQWIWYENLQARIRWNILMSIANSVNGLVVNTSNKTELALWYGTLYGDMIWGLSILWNLNKIQVYQLARHINAKFWKDTIPSEIITRPPSAELSDNQVDPFDYNKICKPVDELLFWAEISKLSKKYDISIEELQRLKKLIKINEYKRRQAPPVVKLHPRSIGIWRIYPIV